MLRSALFAIALLAAATPVALTYAVASDPPGLRAPESLPPYTEFAIGHELLPEPTGWFAVPITTDEDAWVRVEVEASLANQQTRLLTLAQPILALEGSTSMPGFLLGAAPSAPPVHVVHRGGTLMACCDVAMGWGTWDQEMTAPLFLAAGQTLWVGLAAYQFTQEHWFYARVSAQSNLTMGAPIQGLTVDAADLGAEALHAGTHVRALGFQAQPAVGEASRAWTAQGYGLFALQAYRWNEDSSATLSVEVPGVAAMSAPLGDDGVYVSAHRAGSFSARLHDLDVPVLSQNTGVEAVVLFADIDVPGDIAFIYP